MSITEKVLEYRRKIDGLSPTNKRIWNLAHKMMNEMMSSENADLQHCYTSSAKHGDASRKAEDELLELLVAGAADVEKLAREIANMTIGPLLHAKGSTLTITFLDEVAIETEAVLRRSLQPPLPQSPETFFCEQCKRDKPIDERYSGCEDSTICNSCAEDHISGKSL